MLQQPSESGHHQELSLWGQDPCTGSGCACTVSAVPQREFLLHCFSRLAAVGQIESAANNAVLFGTPCCCMRFIAPCGASVIVRWCFSDHLLKRPAMYPAGAQITSCHCWTRATHWQGLGISCMAVHTDTRRTFGVNICIAVCKTQPLLCKRQRLSSTHTMQLRC